MADPVPSQSERQFTPGRFVLASTDAYGARDGAGLLSQLKYMRTGMEGLGHKPALIVLVVDEAELKSAGDLVRLALEPEEGS